MAMLVPLSAGAGPENTTSLARVHHACTAIMGLDPLDWRYHICVSSLKDSLQQLNQARLVSTDRSKCQKQSLEPRGGCPADDLVGEERMDVKDRIDLGRGHVRPAGSRAPPCAALS